MKGFKTPDATNIKLAADRAYGLEFLKLNNLTVGDLIGADFPYHKITYERNVPYKVTFDRKAKGLVRLAEDGTYYLESLEVLPFYRLETSCKRGGKLHETYISEYRKSIIKIRV